MEQDTKERMIAAFEASCVKAGGTLDEGLALFCRFADWASEHAKMARDRKALSDSLSTLPEPTRCERAFLFAVLENLPSLIRVFVRDTADGVVRQLPPPPGGPERNFGPGEEHEICKYITGLHGEGYSKAVAKQSAARKYKTSIATINRIWTARKGSSGRKPPFRRLVEFLRTGKM